MTRLFMSLLLVLCVLSSKGEIVPFNMAQELAYNVMAQGGQTRAAKNLVLITDGETNLTRALGADPTYYLFGSEDGNGFVLIAGDTRCKSVLGYSFNSSYSLQNMPANLKWYLDGIKQIVTELRDSNKPNLSTRSWSGQQSLKEELYYETAQWNQDNEYAADCPLGKFTGSVPTAMAIIMRYHNWPDIGIGNSTAYTTNTSKINVPSRSLLHVYRWKQMPLIPKEKGDFAEISKLMADIGIVLKADYGTTSTGSSTSYLPNVVYMNFQFKNGAQMLNRKNFDSYRWIQMLQAELQQGGPVLMEGNGHAFVLHGYNADKMFAVNWGWGGKMNGYFELYPDSDNDYFINNNRAFFGLRKVDSNILVEGLPKLYMYPIQDKIFKYVEADNKVYFMANTTQKTDFNTTVRLVVVDGSEKVVQVLNEKNYNFGTFVIYYYNMELKNQIKEIQPGYHLELQYKDDNLGLWMPIEYGEKDKWQIPLSNKKSIVETTSFSFDRTQRIITLSVSDKINVELLDTNGTMATMAKLVNDRQIVLDVSKVKCGSYTLRLSNEYETKDVNVIL